MQTAFVVIRRHANDYLDISGIPPKTRLKSSPRLEGLAETARPCTSLKAKFQGRDSMLPSKIMPTTSPFLFTVGDPELPPMMSGVETKFSGVFKSSFAFDLVQLSGK